MDPNETTQRLSEAILDEDFDAAADYANCLATWIRQGGFMPSSEAVYELLKKLSYHFEGGPW